MSDDAEFQSIAQSLIDDDRKLSEGKTVAKVEAGLPAGIAYSPLAMVELMVQHPEWTHARLAAQFNRPASWISQVLASEAFQRAVDPYRDQLDPSFGATMDERFRALAVRATTVLQSKLESSGVNDLVVLKAAEIGVKALGLGQRQPEAPSAPPQNSSQSVAEKIMAAMEERDRKRNRDDAIDVPVREVSDAGD